MNQPRNCSTRRPIESFPCVHHSTRPPRRLARRPCRYSADALRCELVVPAAPATVFPPLFLLVSSILAPTLALRRRRSLADGPLAKRIECRAHHRSPF